MPILDYSFPLNAALSLLKEYDFFLSVIMSSFYSFLICLFPILFSFISGNLLTIPGLVLVYRHVSALGIFGVTALIHPLYGSGEIPQVFGANFFFFCYFTSFLSISYYFLLNYLHYFLINFRFLIFDLFDCYRSDII